MSFAATHLIGFGAGEEAAAWSPLVLSPSFWMDPADLSTLWTDTGASTPVAADGDAVARADDKSGNSRNATQSTSANRPLYKTSAGLHWLAFDGSNDGLATAAFTHSQEWTAAVAIEFNALSVVSGADMIMDADNTSTVRQAQYLRTNNTASQSLCFNTGGTAYTDSGATLSNSTKYTMIAVCQAGAIELFIDNASGGSTANAGTLRSLSSALTIGREASGSSAGPSNIKLYQSLLIPSAISSTDRSLLHTFLNSKMGL